MLCQTQFLFFRLKPLLPRLDTFVAYTHACRYASKTNYKYLITNNFEVDNNNYSKHIPANVISVSNKKIKQKSSNRK